MNDNFIDEKDLDKLIEDGHLTPIEDRQPIIPGAGTNRDPYASGSVPLQLQFQQDLTNTAYGPGIPSIRLMPLAPAGAANVNASISSSVAPVQKTADNAQKTANTANSTAVAANTTATVANTNATTAVTGVATVNAKTAIGIVSGVLQQIPISTLGISSATPTQDNLNDGATYGRVVQTALTSNAIDSTKAGVLAKGGCFPSSIVGSTSSLFTYTATASTHTVVISWTGFTIFFADGTTASISSGTQSITGVTTGTYFYYPFLTASNVVSFVIGATGSSGFTPNILYAPQSPQAAQAINLQSVTSLSASGGISVVMPSSGGGSGGGGGSQLCVRADQFVREKTRGVVRLNTCKPGEFLDSRHGYAEIINLKLIPQATFIRFTVGTGESLCVTPTHHLTAIRSGEELSIEAAKVTLSDVLYHVDGYATIQKIEVVEYPGAKKATLHLEPHHEFWCGETSPSLNAHNQVPVS